MRFVKSAVITSWVGLAIVLSAFGQQAREPSGKAPESNKAGLPLPNPVPLTMKHADGSTTTIIQTQGRTEATTLKDGEVVSKVTKYSTYDGGQKTIIETGSSTVTVESDKNGTIRHMEKTDSEAKTKSAYDYDNKGVMEKALIYRPNAKGEQELQEGYDLGSDHFSQYSKDNAQYNKEHAMPGQDSEYYKHNPDKIPKPEFEWVNLADRIGITDRLNKEAGEIKSIQNQYDATLGLPSDEDLEKARGEAAKEPMKYPTEPEEKPPPMDKCLIGTWECVNFSYDTRYCKGGLVGTRVTFKADGTEIVNYGRAKPQVCPNPGQRDDTITYGGIGIAKISAEDGVAKIVTMTRIGVSMVLDSAVGHFEWPRIPFLGPVGLGSGKGASTYQCAGDTLEYQGSTNANQRPDSKVKLRRLEEDEFGEEGAASGKQKKTSTPSVTPKQISPKPVSPPPVSAPPISPPPISPQPESPSPSSPKPKPPPASGGGAGKPSPATSLQPATPKPAPTPTVSQSPSATTTASASPTAKPTASAIPLLSPPGQSRSPSVTPQPSETPSPTRPSSSAQPQASVNASPSAARSATVTRSPSVSTQPSRTPSALPRQSRTPSPGQSPSAQPGKTPSASPSTSPSPTSSTTPQSSASQSPSSSSSGGESGSPTSSATASATESATSRRLGLLPMVQTDYSVQTIAHDPALPLLIYAGPVGYPATYRVQLVADQSTLSQPAATASPARTPASISFTSSGRTFSVLLSFEVRDDKGNIEQIVVRPLRSAQDLEPSLALEHVGPGPLRFGIDAAEFGKLKSSKYEIRPVFTPEKAGETAWMAPPVPVTPLTIELKKSGMTSEQQKIDMLQAARFYLRERDYTKAEEMADKVRGLDGLSVGAWEIRGEALLAQNKLREAEDAFKTALSNTKTATILGLTSPQEEWPDHISKYLEKARALRKATKK